ncbi:Calpain-8 [Channa argus]|uniref:Calpain-8 n=1 Tax=Channa argus TaxID=215402 RepID=A0A6G1PDW0_CHAAH|nr:Calpain-8 [Channa argus]
MPLFITSAFVCSREWDTIDPAEKKKLDYSADDGEFWFLMSPMEEDINADIPEPNAVQNNMDPHFKHLFVQIAGNDSEISAFELQQILDKVVAQSFQVNSAVVQEIVGQYADPRYAIDFDSFVGCLIRLELLFKMFQALDQKNQGMITLDLQQWLCLAMN